jgi:hypothetical protein
LYVGITMDSIGMAAYCRWYENASRFHLIFRLRAHRFEFRAIDSVYFPPGKAGNVLRGALGTMPSELQAKLPSGLAEPPKPFVLRASHLDGRRFGPGDMFSFGMNIFDLRAPVLERIEETFSQLALAGLGPRRGRVELLRPVITTPVEVDLLEPAESSKRIAVLFRTPTELKGNPAHGDVPFGILFRRIRDRIGTLRSLYGEGALPIDFKALSKRADLVRTVACDLQYREISRRSSRTRAVHGIGGFTGMAEYEGDVAEFVPWLRAAGWTGAGRYTVWGNGAIEVVVR